MAADEFQLLARELRRAVGALRELQQLNDRGRLDSSAAAEAVAALRRVVEVVTTRCDDLGPVVARLERALAAVEEAFTPGQRVDVAILLRDDRPRRPPFSSGCR